MESKDHGRRAYEARYSGLGWAIPWQYLPKRTKAVWARVEGACIEFMMERHIEAIEQVAFASATLDGADDTRKALIEENRLLRKALGHLADTMEAARETLASRRKFDEGLLFAWDLSVRETRQLSAPGRDDAGSVPPLSPD